MSSFRKIEDKWRILWETNRIFEADPNIFQVLHENVRNFELTNVELVPKAVWSCETKLSFHLKGGISSRIATEGDTENITEVEATSLRPYLHRPVDFLKVNIAQRSSLIGIDPAGNGGHGDDEHDHGR